MILSDVDLVWNRAALHAGGPNPKEGDLALAALLRLHGAAMSGGLLLAVEVLTESEYAAAMAGYQFFGLAEVAKVLERSTKSSEDELEELDTAYSMQIPTDSTLFEAFEAKYRLEPAVFAPLES